ncbi:uncharacterized protein LOC124643866 [Helicoverpa zea]|uniref:uncharacterized protein LOC124643866 n=1 Tax=Helicoverpa zea TaxID=7113 RepID=UPI001F56FB69|nr:uncharacterized protein LOC124643866 [Helicoverpa zea]
MAKMVTLCLFLIIVTAFRHSLQDGLKAPECVRLVQFPGKTVTFAVMWNPVFSDDSCDPILGYIAYLWEIKKIKAIIHCKGQPEMVDYGPEVDNDFLRGGLPVIRSVPADSCMVVFRKLKPGVEYEARVKAYTETRESPFSCPSRLKGSIFKMCFPEP